MKLKRLPEDFQVDEITALRSSSGPFSLYQLEKTSLGTPEAIDAILHRWNLSRQQVAYAGLKDRHALTRQFITIHGGPKQNLAQTNLFLEYRGPAERPVEARDIIANRFAIVLRDLTTVEQTAAAAAIDAVALDGLPNYFDEQRFGSLGESGEFIAKPWCLGNYERTLWLALADPNVHDRPDEREQKKILREHWGRWPECKAALDKSHRRSVITFLADKPVDPNFKRAVALVRQDLRSIYLAAFQSDLWNRMLSSLIRQVCGEKRAIPQRIGPREVLFFPPLTADERQRISTTVLPLPSARLHLDDGPAKRLIDEVLADEGLELRQIRVKFPRDAFFSKGERPAVFRPVKVSHAAAADEIYSGKQKLTLHFDLPRGSYATILVKRVTGASVEPEAVEADAGEETAEGPSAEL